jgi:hypothetical protein
MSPLSPKGRDLVRAGRRAFQPTNMDRERLLGALRSQLGDSALPADMGSAANVVAAGRSIWPLISAVVAGIGIVGGALFYAQRPATRANHPQEITSTPIAEPAQAIDPVAAPSAEQPTSAHATPPEADLPAPSGSWARRPQDRLAAEVALLSRATRDLRAGRPAEALKSLDEYRRKFPKGLLGEEQRAARAQALCALGRFDEANEKLAGLAPQSPLAAQAKQFCDARSAAR